MKINSWFPVNGVLEQREIELNNSDKKILIKIHVFGINRADLSQLEGNYFPPEGVTDVLGLEFSGVVEESYEGSCFSKGDRVLGLVQGGAYSEYIRVEEELLIKIPDTMSFTDAAALPEAWCTVLLNLKEIGNLSKDKRVLLHSATGSVGPVAIQYAKYCGCYVIATTRSSEKLNFLKEQGADLAILSSELNNYINTIKSDGGIDIILDPVGQDTFELNQKLLNLNGKIIIIGVMSGKISSIDLGSLLMKRQEIFGSTLRNQPLLIREKLIQDLKEMIPYIISKKLFLPVSKIFSWNNTPDALLFMKENKNKGKILVELIK